MNTAQPEPESVDGEEPEELRKVREDLDAGLYSPDSAAELRRGLDLP